MLTASSEPNAAKLRYRAEIDGLRAIAVLAVVFFHAGLGLPGGFIGVDVFFVISGFLITSLIIRDLNRGTFTLLDFWERRARRILPALVVVVLLTLIAGWFLLLPLDYVTLGRSAIWQAVFGANFYFWQGTGYFTGASEEQPLLHTWSLAVEEQFYMVAPILLLCFHRVAKVERRRILLCFVAAGIVISLALSIYGVAHHPAVSFYLLPTRAWELLCGAFVALVPVSWLLRKYTTREVVAFVGLAGIILPCWLYTKATPFPGIAAMPPCLGTALFIWACTVNDQLFSDFRLPVTARLLTFRPIVAIGIISYSLYLWHWPLFAFSTYWALEPMSLGHRLGLVCVGFLFAVLSWRYVETPFRKRQLCSSRSAMYATSATGISAVFAMGGVVSWGNGFPNRLPREAMDYANTKNDIEGVYELKATDIHAGRLVAIGSKEPNAPVNMLLWGDSHAMAAAPAFDQFLSELGLAGQQATASATAPLLDVYFQSEFTNEKDARAFNDAVFEHIKKHRIPNVVLVGFWEYYTDDIGSSQFDMGAVGLVAA